MRKFIYLFVALTAALPARAAEVTSFSLENGMDVVVIEDHRAPVVVNMLWYRAGSADEPPGKSGIAHFLEHLLFKATDDLESGEFSRTVTQNGGTDNAFTNFDETVYHQRVAADRLELMMMMEADRMRDIRLTEADIGTERDVILEERNERVESNPNALFSEQRQAALFLNHHYGIPIIGWKHEMEQLGLEDALEFYRKYYAPNNTIAIIAGDVDPDEVKALALKHYAPLAPTPGLGPRNRPSEPPQLAERRLIFEDPRISDAYVTRVYLAPSRMRDAQEEAAALVVLSELLSGNNFNSVLQRKLVFEDPKAIYTWSYYESLAYDYSSFGLGILPVPGVSLEDAEAALDGAIAEFLDEGVDPEQLERIKFQLKASMIYAEDSVRGLAERYGSALTAGLTLEDIDAWPAILQAVTAEDVLTAARDVFDKRQSVTGWARAPQPTEEVTQ